MGNKVLLDTFEYAPLSNRVRNLHVLFGPEDKTNKVLFYIHHDIWSSNDNSFDLDFLEELASRGFTIVAPSLVSGNIGSIKAVMEDIYLALKWTKFNFKDLGSPYKGIGLLCSGFGAQLGMLSFASNYSPAFQSLFGNESLNIDYKGIALISPITDIREFNENIDSNGSSINYRQKLLSTIYGPNYQNSILFQKTGSSIDCARSLVSCKAKIMVQSFEKDSLFLANQKAVDNLKLSGGFPLNNIYFEEKMNMFDYLMSDNKDIYKKPMDDLSEYCSNLWNYD